MHPLHVSQKTPRRREPYVDLRIKVSSSGPLLTKATHAVVDPHGASTQTPDPSWPLVAHAKNADLTSDLGHLTNGNRVKAERACAKFCPWKIQGTFLNTARSCIIELRDHVLSYAWDIAIRYMEDGYAYFLDYYNRTALYLSVVREDEVDWQVQKRLVARFQQRFHDALFATLPPRKWNIKHIAAAAGLRPDEVTYLALAGDSFVRAQVQWEHREGPMMKISSRWLRLDNRLRSSMSTINLWWSRLGSSLEDVAFGLASEVALPLIMVLWVSSYHIWCLMWMAWENAFVLVTIGVFIMMFWKLLYGLWNW